MRISLERAAAAVAAGLTVLVALAGCGAPGPSDPTTEHHSGGPDELADAHGRPCPRQLPLGEDPSGHGFGSDEPAEQRPSLLEPLAAWVCEYGPIDLGRTASGGTVYGWRRAGRPVEVDAADLPRLDEAMSQLAPADSDRACTADLGPRWMVVTSHEGDLTGIVVDDFGCRDVRLTGEPHATPAGADGQDGAVGGVLDGGLGVLEALGVGRTS